MSLLGTSIGTGVATYVASERPIKKLGLVTPFDSIAKTAQQIFKMYPVSILIKDKFESDKRVDKITSPTIIFIAEKDEIIPRNRTDELVKKFDQNKLTVIVINNATHNSITMNPEFTKNLEQFFN